MRSSPFLRAILALCLILLLGTFTFAAKTKTSKKAPAKAGLQHGPTMSPMGQLARRVARAINSGQVAQHGTFAAATPNAVAGQDDCIADDSCGDDDSEGYTEGPAGGQGETSIAIDSTGQHVVVGFNDQRGFALNPTSVSGYAYSDDGGVTFTDGGLLPITVPTVSIAGTIYPQSFGDPDVKYLGGCTFIYAVIEVVQNPANAAGTAQTMGIHRSTDCGHTWAGPFAVGPATNPNGLQSGVNARDSADKEQIGVDPKTGRVMLTWTNFTTANAGRPRGREISATYSDDAAFATPPTWSARKVIGTNSKDGQASVPRFDAHSNNVYVVWEQFSVTGAAGSFGGLGENIGFARSTDNGLTWEPEKSLRATDTFTMDYNLGNDRVHNFPSLEVDNSSGPNSGTVYVVQADNKNNDGSDIAFLKSTDGGLTFTAPVLINARPGLDRSQWFPYVTVDNVTGRVWVTYDDQGIATSGDLMEMAYQYSDNGGATWSRPTPFSAQPFHAGWGNDTGQPNLGDYNQSVAQSGNLYAEYALASLNGFTDGEPSGSMTSLDAAMGFVASGTNQVSLRMGSITFTESGGNGRVDAGDRVFFNIPLTNYVTNPINAGTIGSISGTLSSSTPGVSILRANATYPALGAGASGNPSAAYVVQLSPTYVSGTPLNLTLNVSSAGGTTKLLYTQPTGTPVATTVLAEDFNSTAPGTLPAGWSNLHAGGTNTVPWTTSNTFCGGSNAAFHINANDAANPTRFERLLSPLFNVPANAQDVTIDMDVCYNTEDDGYGQLGAYAGGIFNWLAYDGFTLRISHFTDPNTVVRSVLAEAFEEELTTGAIQHFPKHFPRNSSTSYFQDMSAWAGYSNGVQHVRMRLPGMQGTLDQLRFEYTQDSGGICTDLRPGPCGVMVDNITVSSIVYVANELATLTLRPTTTKGLYTGTLTTQAVAPAGGVTANLSSSAPTKTTMPASVTIPAGSTTSGAFNVQIDPTYTGVTVTITATGPSNSRSAAVKFF